MKPKSQVKTAVGYARTATAQKGESAGIRVQKEKIKEYCIKNGLKLSKIYSDFGKSGNSLERPALQDMLIQCSRGETKHLIVYDSSRLSRDTKDYLTIRALLAKYKVEIISLMGISSSGDDPYSKFFDEILACVNALYPRLNRYQKEKKNHKGRCELGTE